MHKNTAHVRKYTVNVRSLKNKNKKISRYTQYPL